MGLLEVNSYELHSYGDTGYRGMFAIGSLLSHSCRSVFLIICFFFLLKSELFHPNSLYKELPPGSTLFFMPKQSNIFCVTFLEFPPVMKHQLWKLKSGTKSTGFRTKKEPATNKDDLSFSILFD